ncbi:hypothetical protein VNO77_26875 [Canavalia gladiata]|uniref:Uncharacterized protein n=1 Tax=Canavalia gladiata TaxID=3824 RepID=A0AAN9QA07_CANGL
MNPYSSCRLLRFWIVLAGSDRWKQFGYMHKNCHFLRMIGLLMTCPATAFTVSILDLLCSNIPLSNLLTVPILAKHAFSTTRPAESKASNGCTATHTTLRILKDMVYARLQFKAYIPSNLMPKRERRFYGLVVPHRKNEGLVRVIPIYFQSLHGEILEFLAFMVSKCKPLPPVATMTSMFIDPFPRALLAAMQKRFPITNWMMLTNAHFNQSPMRKGPHLHSNKEYTNGI